jgi:hypothetical protein
VAAGVDLDEQRPEVDLEVVAADERCGLAGTGHHDGLRRGGAGSEHAGEDAVRAGVAGRRGAPPGTERLDVERVDQPVLRAGQQSRQAARNSGNETRGR